MHLPVHLQESTSDLAQAASGATPDPDTLQVLPPLLAEGPWAPWFDGIEAWALANQAWATGLALLLVLVVGAILHRVVQHYILNFVEYVARQTPQQWDQALFEARFPHRLAWGLPLLVWYFGLLVVPFLPADPLEIIRRILLAGMVVVLVRAFDAFLDGVNRIYQQNPRARERPIKGFLQVANVVAHMAGMILVIATLMDKSPLIFLSGLGAMTAVLLLVFRDTLLSLVAGIQITMNDLIRAGDWIEMPQFQANGAVVDIALNSITVQNWDRTLSSIPTHKFLEHSFKNWRGMVQSGGRRMMRSVYLDQQSVRFLTEDEIEKFGTWELLGDYMGQKRTEIDVWNQEHAGDGNVIPHRRRLTNIGTLRAYLVAYLKAHPGLHPEMMTMVRQLDPTPEGIPMEIYGFANTTEWAIFEGIQGDIFDHVLATIPEFGLRLYQKPSGIDIRQGVESFAGHLEAGKAPV